MKTRAMVVSGHYRRDGDGVVIELFCRAEDGRSLTCLYHGFKPYFYIVEPGPSVRSELEKDPEVLGLDERELWTGGMERNCLKVTIRFPFDVPSYRKRYREKSAGILAADIPFIYRFFYDMDLGSYLEIRGEEIESDMYTTDIVLEVSSLETTDPFKVRLKALSFDIENSIRTGELYMIGHSMGWLQLDEGDPTREGHFVPPDDIDEPMEREDLIIQSLEDLIEREDPDIITGYNIDGYDIPHIQRRAKLISIEGIRMGRDRSFVDNQGYRSWRARGRIVVDAWWQAKKVFRPKKETLESVSRSLLGEGKDDIDTSIIEEEWINRRDEVISYCERDSRLALRILDRTQSVNGAMALSYVAKLPLFDILSGTTSNLIDSILIREADRRNIGIPMTRREKKTSKIEGAYVHSIDPGLYHWVIVLDFRSMYPSLMIENNICFTTITSREDGNIASPVPGVYFLPEEKKKGLVPDILADLMERRMEAKREMKEAETGEEKEFYDGLQSALKVLMNSFYGVFASYFYRFTDRSIGSSITAYARENIRSIISTLQEEDMDVIYSDTDSVFVRSPSDELDGTLKAGERLSERFSDGARVLEFEKVFSSFFTHGKKKRYVGKVVWPSQSLVVRGYEMRRTDSFDIQSESLSHMFDLILSDREKEAVKYARKIISDVKSGNVPTSKLVISRSVQEVEERKIRERYKNPDSMANIQALRKTRKMGVEVVPGMKVSWIVVDAGAKPQHVEPYLENREFHHKPDHGYYAERLASTLSRVTEVLGVDERELLSGAEQTSLLDDFGGEEVKDRTVLGQESETGKREEEKSEGSTTTLDNWM